MARLNLATCGAEHVVGGELCITGDSTGPQGTQLQDPVQRQWDLEEQRLLPTPKLGGSKLRHCVAMDRGQHCRI